MSATTRDPSFIDPHRLYSHRGLIVATGLSQTRIREAARKGINCRRIWVGRRCFYRGRDIILWIEELAAADIRQCVTLSEQAGE